MLRKDIIIISLAAIVPADIQAAIDAYAGLIADKIGADLKIVKGQIGRVLAEKLGVLNAFKNGALNEAGFNVDAFAGSSGVKPLADVARRAGATDGRFRRRQPDRGGNR